MFWYINDGTIRLWVVITAAHLYLCAVHLWGQIIAIRLYIHYTLYIFLAAKIVYRANNYFQETFMCAIN
jgi:hypothetical protein